MSSASAVLADGEVGDGSGAAGQASGGSSVNVAPHITAESVGYESRDSIEDVFGPRTPYVGDWPVRVDERVTEPPDQWVQSACVMCSNGCGMDIGVKQGKIVGVRGRKEDRVNKGRLGPKGLHACWTSVQHADRLTHPLIRRDGQLVRASWEEAMSLIVDKSREVQGRLSSHGIGIYTSGQLFLEEYHALAMLGKAGLGSLHMDGNTRLCTATAAAAMRESFGSDGQPGSYSDIDTTDCIMLVGHNVAATQTVLWARMLDRLHGPRPPQLIVIDPRRTVTAQSATLHLAPAAGTNVCLLNGLQHLLIKDGHINTSFVQTHTVGYDELCRVVDKYTPELVEQVTGVPAAQLRRAASILGTAKTLLSTALQGVYQSNQATAAACQINNINLLLGQIGRPGAGLYQMNGQPTAQNNREAGCDGEYPGFRNFQNEQHMAELAQCWNVDIAKLPHWAESPTHIMQMLQYIEEGSIEMLWIIGTNPLVSLPNLERIRRLLTLPSLFVVVQDIFMTESAQLADLVLPAAMWGEKTGCFTNVDRTVHISHRAVQPPGECRSDFDIFVDYARRMGFEDKDGRPLLPWTSTEQAFEHWKTCSVGRPCDYSGLSYEKLSKGSGIQWPCNALSSPNGTERLFSDWHFYTDHDYCESYGHDLETGTPYTEDEYRKLAPAGRAILKSCHYRPGEEAPSADYPLRLTTGRNVYHFHTRTKTGRDRHLARAAGDAFVQMSAQDAAQLGVRDGDMVVCRSARGSVEARAKVGDIEPGHVFIPFHYGTWDAKDDRPRAANELTATSWDAISKQPLLKAGTVRVERVDGGVQIHSRSNSGQDVHAPSRPGEAHQRQSDAMRRAASKHNHNDSQQQQQQPQARHIHLEDALMTVVVGVELLVPLYEQLTGEHGGDMELRSGLKTMAELAHKVSSLLQPSLEQHRSSDAAVTSRIRQRVRTSGDALIRALFPAGRLHGEVSASYAAVRDMQALYTLVQGTLIALASITPAAAALQDTELADLIRKCQHEMHRQAAWAQAKVHSKSPQTLVVPTAPAAAV